MNAMTISVVPFNPAFPGHPPWPPVLWKMCMLWKEYWMGALQINIAHNTNCVIIWMMVRLRQCRNSVVWVLLTWVKRPQGWVKKVNGFQNCEFCLIALQYSTLGHINLCILGCNSLFLEPSFPDWEGNRHSNHSSTVVPKILNFRNWVLRHLELYIYSQ